MQIAIIIIYGLVLSIILFYSIMQLGLVISYHKSKTHRSSSETGNLQQLRTLPPVTIQLPVFNEMYVVERLIRTVAKLNYPASLLEIQVLDDSTDETKDICQRLVRELRSESINIVHIRRDNRKGYKAGALENGLKLANGEFIAIFDADFVPEPDFLQQTIPFFKEPKIGLVQTRWGHINKDYSVLTRLQAFGLDAHFTVEQAGRNHAGYFINFNGTAGIWRRECIINSGGWQFDTLTEDLDLSYRAQLNGWKFKYLEQIVSPAELPVVMSAVKAQQFRWTKGGAETFRKSIGNVLKAKNIKASQKIHAFFHLLNSGIFICVLIASLLSVPVLFIKVKYTEYNTIFNLSSLFLICTFILLLFYWYSYSNSSPSNWRWLIFIREFVLFLSTSMGLSLHNSLAVMEGYIGKKSSFVRTPKFNIVKNSDAWVGNKYVSRKISITTLIEGLLSIYFVLAMIAGIYYTEYGLLPFHAMLSFGFMYVFITSVKS